MNESISLTEVGESNLAPCLIDKLFNKFLILLESAPLPLYSNLIPNLIYNAIFSSIMNPVNLS